MEKMRWKSWNGAAVPMLLLLIAIVVLHHSIEFTRDDLLFAQYPFSWELVLHRYAVWTSRTLIEAVLMLVARLPVMVWKVADISIMWLFCCLLAWYAAPRGRFSQGVWCALVAWLFFPWEILSTAGWCATTLNYLWPATAGLVAMIPWKQSWEGRPVSRKLWGVSILALIFALNAELTWIFLAPIFAISLFAMWKQHHFPRGCFIHAAVFLLSFAWIATCPGNRMRFMGEMYQWWPDYMATPLGTKLMLGLENMGIFLIFRDNMMLLVGGLLVWMVWHEMQNKLWRCISLIPIVLKVAGMYYAHGHKDAPFWAMAAQQMPHAFNPALNESARGKLLLLVAASALALLIIGACFAFVMRKWRLVGIYLLGLGNPLMMALSPTLFASDTRIFFLLDMTWMFLWICCVTGKDAGRWR